MQMVLAFINSLDDLLRGDSTKQEEGAPSVPRQSTETGGTRRLLPAPPSPARIHTFPPPPRPARRSTPSRNTNQIRKRQPPALLEEILALERFASSSDHRRPADDHHHREMQQIWPEKICALLQSNGKKPKNLQLNLPSTPVRPPRQLRPAKPPEKAWVRPGLRRSKGRRRDREREERRKRGEARPV
jgi:hypothetical protein